MKISILILSLLLGSLLSFQAKASEGTLCDTNSGIISCSAWVTIPRGKQGRFSVLMEAPNDVNSYNCSGNPSYRIDYKKESASEAWFSTVTLTFGTLESYSNFQPAAKEWRAVELVAPTSCTKLIIELITN